MTLLIVYSGYLFVGRCVYTKEGESKIAKYFFKIYLLIVGKHIRVNRQSYALVLLVVAIVPFAWPKIIDPHHHQTTMWQVRNQPFIIFLSATTEQILLLYSLMVKLKYFKTTFQFYFSLFSERPRRVRDIPRDTSRA